MNSLRSVWVSALALVAICMAGASQAEAPSGKWNQDRVTKIAEELVDAVKELRDTVRREPPPSTATMQSRAYHRFVDSLRLAENESKHLVRLLKDDKGHDETLPVFERLESIRRNAAEESRRLYMPNPVVSKIDSARDVLMRLRPYYPEL